MIEAKKNIRSSGCVKVIDIQVFDDEACTQPAEHVDWGSVNPGGNSRRRLFVKNVKRTTVTLSLDTANCSPSELGGFMGLTWDFNGQSMGRDEVIGVSLTLSIASDITGIEDFIFDIVIGAREAT